MNHNRETILSELDGVEYEMREVDAYVHQGVPPCFDQRTEC